MSPTGIAAIVAALAFTGLGALYYKERASHAQTKVLLATEKAGRADDRAAGERAARVQSDDFAAQASTWRATQMENANANRTFMDQLQGKLSRALAVGDSVRQRADALAAAAGKASGNPGSEPAGQTAAQAADLLAYMFRRVDEAAGGITEFADRAAAARDLCIKDYDSLTTKLGATP